MICPLGPHATSCVLCGYFGYFSCSLIAWNLPGAKSSEATRCLLLHQHAEVRYRPPHTPALSGDFRTVHTQSQFPHIPDTTHPPPALGCAQIIRCLSCLVFYRFTSCYLCSHPSPSRVRPSCHCCCTPVTTA